MLLPATPGWVSLPLVVGGPRHSWLGSAGGGGVWCVAVVCWWGCGWCVVWFVPRHSWRRFHVCYSPPLLAGFRCRWWWAVPATAGWGPLAAVVCGVWCVVCGVLVGLWLVCGVVGPSPLLAEVPVCYSPPLLAGFRCRWWWAVPATPGWGPLAAVVCGVWCVVCGVWCVAVVCWWGCGWCVVWLVPGHSWRRFLCASPRHSWLGFAAGGGRRSPPLLAGVRWRRWCVVCGVWCVAVVCCWGCGWCVVWLVPRHSWRRSLYATRRHSWLGFAAGGGGRSPPLLARVRWRQWCVGCGVWCVVCWWGSSPLLAEVPVCYSPPLLAGFRCRWWWAVPATPGWGPLAAVVCGVWCVAVVCWWGCGWVRTRPSGRPLVCVCVRVRSLLGRVGRAGLLGAFWCASPFLLAALSFCFAWPLPGWGCPSLFRCCCRSTLVVFLGLPLPGSPCARASFVSPAWPLAALWWLLPWPPPLLCLAVFVAPAWCLGVFFFFLLMGRNRLRCWRWENLQPASTRRPSHGYDSRAIPSTRALCHPSSSSSVRPRCLRLCLVSGPGCPGPRRLCCLLCWLSASRLSVRLSLFRDFRLVVGCSCVVAAPPPPLCVSRFSFLPLGAVCRVVLWVPACGAAPRCCALCRPVLCCRVLCCARLVPLLVAPCPLALPVALGPCALRRCVLRCSPALCALCCVCFVVARWCVLLFAALPCAVCVSGCCAVRSLCSPFCAVLVRSRCAVRVVRAVAGAWCCGALLCVVLFHVVCRGAVLGLVARGCLLVACFGVGVPVWPRGLLPCGWCGLLWCPAFLCRVLWCCAVAWCCAVVLCCRVAVLLGLALPSCGLLCCAVLCCWLAVLFLARWWCLRAVVLFSSCCAFPVFSALCAAVPCCAGCGALLPCVVCCGAVLSCRAVLSCSAVVFRCCLCLLCPPAACRAAPVWSALLLVPRAVACPCALWCLPGRSAVWWCCSGVSWCLAVLCGVLWCPAPCAVSCGAVLPCGAVLVGCAVRLSALLVFVFRFVPFSFAKNPCRFSVPLKTF